MTCNNDCASCMYGKVIVTRYGCDKNYPVCTKRCDGCNDRRVESTDYICTRSKNTIRKKWEEKIRRVTGIDF